MESDILYIQSFGNYVRVHVENKFYLASATTQEILSNLSSKLFVRIHKSYIVNLNRISEYSEKEVVIAENKIPVGITFKRDFLNSIR
ncbi:LytR/AlgR family response regulator transcription factor [Elizabethkingia anophelis]|uniref:LytR/AlgR family response regulator transcription factor n=1 Tax=Elizabethkingia anophelis TaxID=1117645 RepID=UPI0037BF287E